MGFGSLGIQYNQLQGSALGYGVYIEALFLVNLDKVDFFPAGSLGMLYYF